MKFKEMAKMSADERDGKRKELEMELIKMNTQVATGTPPKNAGLVSRLKKDIAKMLFLQSIDQKKAAGQKAKPKIKKEEGKKKKNE
jgi:ribosomal protein L29